METKYTLNGHCLVHSINVGQLMKLNIHKDKKTRCPLIIKNPFEYPSPIKTLSRITIIQPLFTTYERFKMS